MNRILLLLLCLLPQPQRQQQPPATATGTALEARFIGNMAFAITDGATAIMTDFPYQSGYSGYMTYDAAEIRSPAASTLALVTHRHADHWEPRLFGRTDWKVLAPADATAGIDAARLIAPAPRVTFGAVQIQPIETPHARIGHYSYLVTWHGRRLYFSGDTESPDSLLGAGPLDVAFVSPWIYRAALRDGRRIDAKLIVIYHHQPGERIPECGQGCGIPKQGETIRF